MFPVFAFAPFLAALVRIPVALMSFVLVGVASPSAVAAPPRRILAIEQTLRKPVRMRGIEGAETFRNDV